MLTFKHATCDTLDGVDSFYTLYLCLSEIAHPKEGETVFVSGAAGAVGSLVGQIAKLKGCRVVGSAGEDDKVELLKQLGFDEAFNYKTVGDINQAVAKACPKGLSNSKQERNLSSWIIILTTNNKHEGVDVYFDNVGGPISDAVTLITNNYGRISVCGQISYYNEEEVQLGPRYRVERVERVAYV